MTNLSNDNVPKNTTKTSEQTTPQRHTTSQTPTKRKNARNLSQIIINTTLKEIGRNGLSNLTTKTISQQANTSTGIIHHYFDTKDQLVLSSYTAMVRQHRSKVLDARKKHLDNPFERLRATVEVQFDERLFPDEQIKVWPQFWANAMHNQQVSRLLLVNNNRMINNLIHDLAQLYDDKAYVHVKAHAVNALVHGLWIERFIVKTIDSEMCLDTILSTIKTA